MEKRLERVVKVQPSDNEKADTLVTVRTDGVITHTFYLGPEDEATVTLTTLIEAPNVSETI